MISIDKNTLCSVRKLNTKKNTYKQNTIYTIIAHMENIYSVYKLKMMVVIYNIKFIYTGKLRHQSSPQQKNYPNDKVQKKQNTSTHNPHLTKHKNIQLKINVN